MKFARLALLPLLTALAFHATPGFAGDEPLTKFTRFQEGEEDAGSTLETAYAVYGSKDTDVEVVLYGVVHIADKGYYKSVQKDLSSYEVVLFEGVGTPGKKPVEPDEQMKTIGEMQGAMSKLLGLQFQKDG